MATELPAVFVMNPYYTGLGIARSLRGRGVRVVALTSEPETPGARSRDFHRVYEVPNGRDEPEKLRDRLLQIAAGQGEQPVLVPTRDFDVLFLEHYHAALAPAYRLPQRANSSILRLMDKYELARVAWAHGIPTPAALVCPLDDPERHASGLRYPLVVKPRFAYEWRRKGIWEKVGAAKAIIVSTPQELRARCRALGAVAKEVLLQEYVEGADADIVVCCCYIGAQGQLLGHFTARKLKQSPPLIGTGCVVEALAVPRVIALSVQLLKAFGYTGLAEVEFKFDCASGAYQLIEVNPRHWDQHELGTLVGVNMSWIAYSDIAGLGSVTQNPVYREVAKYKWIAERELIYATARNLATKLCALRAGKAGLYAYLAALSSAFGELTGLMRGRKILGLMSLRDPMPGLLMWRALLWDALRSFHTSFVAKRHAHGARPSVAGTGHRHEEANMNLLKWTQEDAEAYGREVVLARHCAHERELFSDAALIDLLESYPRSQLQAFTMGTNPLQRYEWQPVDTAGASARDLWTALKLGRLWFNVLQIHRVDARYRDLLGRLYEELAQQCPGFRPFRTSGTLILSSPTALVYYHADAQPNLLWQMRGAKRIWVYPAQDTKLVDQELMEDIFANFADEEIPYSYEFDKKARVYELGPGQVLSWPQNAPHRVTNTEGINVSLSTVHETEETDRRKLVYCANRLFRRSYGVPLRSTAESGWGSYMKRVSYRAFRRAGWVKTAPRRAYLARLRIDAASPSGVSPIPEAPVLTEFSRKEFRLEKSAAGNVSVVHLGEAASSP